MLSDWSDTSCSDWSRFDERPLSDRESEDSSSEVFSRSISFFSGDSVNSVVYPDGFND